MNIPVGNTDLESTTLKGPYPAPDIDFSDLSGPLRQKSLGELRAAQFVLKTIQSPWLMRAGRSLAKAGLALRIPGTRFAIKQTVFRQFCGGVNLKEAVERAGRLYRHGIACILDFAVEGEDSEEDFDKVADELLRVVDVTAERPEIVFAAVKMTGVARFGLLEKLGADNAPGFNDHLSAEEQQELARAEARLNRICERASTSGTSVFMDAEHSWIQTPIDNIVERLMATYNSTEATLHTTVQLYLRDRLQFLEEAIRRARVGNYRLGVKLVRGAYMEQENERAEELRYESPVQPSKQATDDDYNKALTLCLENLDVVSVCAATHNITSTKHLISEMARLGIAKNDPRVTASQLLGMFDRITVPLAENGYNALKYLPYGEVRDAFPYLLRRADENKSVADQLALELDAVNEELLNRSKRGRKRQ